MTIIKDFNNKVFTIETNGWRIQNVPAYALHTGFITFRICDDEAWFYGAYETMDRAFEVACEVGGLATPVI